MYYYFPAKGDLLEALAEPCLERLVAVITDPPDTAELANCRDLLDAYLAMVGDWSPVVALLIGDLTTATFPATMRCRADRERLRELFARAVRRRRPYPCDVLCGGGGTRGFRVPGGRYGG